MKKNYLFVMMFALLANGCVPDPVPDPEPIKIYDMDMRVSGSWSDDLLKFVTPTFSYKDAKGAHQLVIEEGMTNDDIWDYEGEVIDFHSRSWNHAFTYAYTFDMDTMRLKMEYSANENVEIIDTASYTFEHDFGVNSASILCKINDTHRLYTYTNISIEIGTPNEKKYRGTEVRQFIDSLISHPTERKITFQNGEFDVN